MNHPAVWAQWEGEQVIAPKFGSPVWIHTRQWQFMVSPNYTEDGMGCYKNYKCSFNITDIITLTASAEDNFSSMQEKTSVIKEYKTLMELTKCFRSSASLNLAWEISWKQKKNIVIPPKLSLNWCVCVCVWVFDCVHVIAKNPGEMFHTYTWLRLHI